MEDILLHEDNGTRISFRIVAEPRHDEVLVKIQYRYNHWEDHDWSPAYCGRSFEGLGPEWLSLDYSPCAYYGASKSVRVSGPIFDALFGPLPRRIERALGQSKQLIDKYRERKREEARSTAFAECATLSVLGVEADPPMFEDHVAEAIREIEEASLDQEGYESRNYSSPATRATSAPS